MKAGWIICTIAAFLLSAPAWAQPVEIEAEGSAVTREDAVSRALVAAVEQVTGVRVDAQAVSRQQGLQVATTTGERVELSASSSMFIQRQAGGIVRSYRVLALDRQPDGVFLARVWVEVERFQPTAPTGDSRRRLVISEFRDEARRETEFGRRLRERLTQHLTQSRRFAVLDRQDDAVYSREMAVLLTDAPLAERVRVGQVLGADYVVVGRLRGVGESRTERSIGITGETVTAVSARGEVNFQVIEMATRQVRWAASVSIERTSNMTALVETIAGRMGQEITQTIYPMRVIRADSPDEIILNQGGVTVTVGQRFRAMVLGEELKDPYTGESLGQTEREIGVVQVTRVDARVSYARLVGGALPPQGSDVVLRPAPPPPPPPRAAQQRPASERNRSVFD